jgi:hypothetical protein
MTDSERFGISIHDRLDDAARTRIGTRFLLLPAAPRTPCVRPVPTRHGVGSWLHNDSTPGRDALWMAYDRC